MILERTHQKNSLGSSILPKGDRYDLPPGRRQFGLASLFGLLTAGSLVAAFCRWMGLEPVLVLILEIYVVIAWWNIAKLRVESTALPSANQKGLRDEVRRWLRGQERR
ncbi:hypothetical protein [Bythopirellula polymerisocia]|nr:hypothetical protein [Bythopirellula polymerisocia]